MLKNVKLLALMVLLPMLLSCGNKGDLYQEADPAVELELEEAAEKLKKSKSEKPVTR